jgi:hypothetical protein
VPAQLAGWLRPFVTVFVIATIIAFAATLVLDRVLAAPDTPPPVLVPSDQHRIEVRVIQTDGVPQSLRCLTRPGVETKDVVTVAPADFGTVTSQLCADA